MPWKAIFTVELRKKLVSATLAGDASVPEMSRCYGISRMTAYKWIERYNACGRGGLADQSRVPWHSPTGSVIGWSMRCSRRCMPT
jgi:transposase